MINGKMGTQEKAEANAKSPPELVNVMRALHALDRDIVLKLQQRFGCQANTVDSCLQWWQKHQEDKPHHLLSQAGVCPGFYM